MKFATLADALAERRASKCAIHFVEGDNNERDLPFGDLYARALGLLRHFQASGAKAGSEMILLLDSNTQFIDAFWACMLGNIIAVPLAPGNTDEHKAKVFRVFDRLKNPRLCTDQKIFSRLSAFATGNALAAGITRLKKTAVFLDLIDDLSQPGQPSPARPNDIAFVQYSSGSTSEPKGVSLSHCNILTNIAAIAQGIQLAETDIGLSWMPLTHDMGLIGFHLTPFVNNITHHIISTSVFVRRPQLWLTHASAQKATILCSPNFGYRHFLNSFDRQKPGALDLRNVRILFNGAEPISVPLCEEFLTAMAPYGLSASAMFPVYGLAEASLAATFSKPGAGYATITVNRNALTVGQTAEIIPAEAAHAVALMLLGKPVLDCDLRIADDAGATLVDGCVGHVEIRGDNVTSGYYLDPESTQTLIRKNGWLRTGDLGFLSDRGLAITGRAKEVLFVSGQNYYPHDLEAVLEKHAGLELGKVAVCGARPVHAETDELIAFVLHKGDLHNFVAIARSVRKCVNEHIGVAVNHVLPIARFPKTTSGKIQRFLLAESYQKGEFTETLARLRELAPQYAEAPSARNELEKNLLLICGEFIKDKPIGAHDNIFELGTSSLTLAQIYQRIEVIYPGQLEVTDFFDYPTIAQLAGHLESRLHGSQV